MVPTVGTHLMYLAMLLGYFFVNSQGMTGVTEPMRKKNTRAVVSRRIVVSSVATKINDCY